MRLSVHKYDPGYNKQAYGSKVFVDDKEILFCYTADTTLGIAYCYENDGNAVILNEDKTEILRKEIKGKVEVAWYGNNFKKEFI